MHPGMEKLRPINGRKKVLSIYHAHEAAIATHDSVVVGHGHEASTGESVSILFVGYKASGDSLLAMV